MHKLHDPMVKRMKAQSYLKYPQVTHICLYHISLHNLKTPSNLGIGVFVGISLKSDLLDGKFQESLAPPPLFEQP